MGEGAARAVTRLGCTGWGYDDWRGGFYPKGTPPSEYLERYARVFSFAEVDSSYYRLPSPEQTGRWDKATPKGFVFSAKLPGVITHDQKLRVDSRVIDGVLDAFQPLRKAGKLGPLVMQTPPSLRFDVDADALRAFLGLWPRDWPLAVELRNRSWWRAETYAMLRDAGAVLVWSDSQYGRTPPESTVDDLAYVRVVGDREIEVFDRIQRDRTDDLRYWTFQLERQAKKAKIRYFVVNNHLMGFAPGTAAIASSMLGLETPDLGAAAREPGQRSLGGF